MFNLDKIVVDKDVLNLYLELAWLGGVPAGADCDVRQEVPQLSAERLRHLLVHLLSHHQQGAEPNFPLSSRNNDEDRDKC